MDGLRTETVEERLERLERANRTLNGQCRRWRRAGTVVLAGVGLLFLAGQLLLWQQYQAAGYYLAANPANAFFYLLTSLHGLHLVGGVLACARVAGQRTEPSRIAHNIGLCAIYWHFLLLVWVLLAGLLVST